MIIMEARYYTALLSILHIHGNFPCWDFFWNKKQVFLLVVLSFTSFCFCKAFPSRSVFLVWVSCSLCILDKKHTSFWSNNLKASRFPFLRDIVLPSWNSSVINDFGNFTRFLRTAPHTAVSCSAKSWKKAGDLYQLFKYPIPNNGWRSLITMDSDVPTDLIRLSRWYTICIIYFFTNIYLWIPEVSWIFT